MGVILRDSNTVTCVVGDSVAESTSIDFRDFSSGIIVFTTEPTSPVRVHVSTDDVNFYALSDSGGGDVDLLTPGENEAIAFPDEVFPAHFVKFVSGSTTADITCTVMLKG